MIAKDHKEQIIICVPCFNEERYLGDCLDSLKLQTYSNFKVIIGDNASTDRTEIVCKRYVDSDSRFKYYRHDANIGSARNSQFLLSLGRSEYVMVLGAHDKIHPTYLDRMKSELDRDPTISLVYSATAWIDASGNVTAQSTPDAFGKIRGNPYQRYIRSIRAPGERTAINHLTRRSAYAGITIEPVLGCDEIVIAQLLFRGVFKYIAEPLYYRRHFSTRSEGYSARITGDSENAPSYRKTMKLFIDNYKALPSHDVTKQLYRPWLYWEAASHCEQDIFSVVPALRRTFKRILPRPVVRKIQRFQSQLRRNKCQ